MHGPRKRAVLTKHQAVEIFSLRGLSLIPQASYGDFAISSRSVIVSRLFGVSPKAVRDIWNKRTWRHSTSPLSPETERTSLTEYLKAVEDMTCHQLTKRAQGKGVGRPRGSKDSKPRKARRPHRNDIMSKSTQLSSQEYAGNFHEHKSERNCSNTTNSNPTMSQESTRERCEVQSMVRVEFSSESHIHAAVTSPCVSMPHWDRFLAHDACVEECEEACLRRSYPFFLQW